MVIMTIGLGATQPLSQRDMATAKWKITVVSIPIILISIINRFLTH